MKQTAAALFALWVATVVAAAAAPAPSRHGVGGGSASAKLVPSPHRPSLLAVTAARHTSGAHAGITPVEPTPMETIVHKKEAGNGYKKGSPLYAKQEGLKTTGTENLASGNETLASKGKDGEPKTALGMWMKYPLEMLFAHVFYVLFIAGVAYTYKRLKRDGYFGGSGWSKEEAPVPYDGDAFTYGFCDVTSNCKEDWPIWLSACCCPHVRWSDTVSSEQTPFVNFWVALFVVLGLEILGPILGGVWGTATMFALIGMYFRQRLRLVFGHHPKKVKTMFLDVLAWCCCPVCSIVQEAREVEKVRRKVNGQVYLPPQP